VPLTSSQSPLGIDFDFNALLLCDVFGKVKVQAEVEGSPDPSRVFASA
jgi:hypothetical protein